MYFYFFSPTTIFTHCVRFVQTIQKLTTMPCRYKHATFAWLSLLLPCRRWQGVPAARRRRSWSACAVRSKRGCVFEHVRVFGKNIYLGDAATALAFFIVVIRRDRFGHRLLADMTAGHGAASRNTYLRGRYPS